MYKVVVVIILSIILSSCTLQKIVIIRQEICDAEIVGTPKEQLKSTDVVVPPEFPGGVDAYADFLSENLKYPNPARFAGIQGSLIVSCVVTSSGAIEDVQIYQSLGPDCDEEALRIVGLMPKWNPGRLNGIPVNVKVKIPFSFKLTR